MTVYLDVDDLLASARAFLGAEPQVRDAALLSSALARPAAQMYGVEAYPELIDKAAALLISVTNNHALVDGNKRLGWVATRLFFLLNGPDLAMPHDDAYDLVMAIADSSRRDVVDVSAALRPWVNDVD
ncbi:type II toxin-antitoxin system death-on-curing family toxin [Miniimonas sp. S16]|uniref:type II toxin-antitoxin system death-on-curing family toxin n=1 Tax=Miniimonas sp. S16 TaxID=2171623 RepID=UPI000D526513|nr:Fic family protein [Miniimonas sp. S16]